MYYGQMGGDCQEFKDQYDGNSPQKEAICALYDGKHSGYLHPYYELRLDLAAPG
jgi:hypothetical protein